MKAKINNRNSVTVIDYDKEVENIERAYEADIELHGVSDGVLQPIMDKEEKKRTEEEVGLINKRKQIEEDKEAAMKLLSDYYDFIPSDFEGDLGEFEISIPYYVKKGNEVIQKWEVKKGDESKITSKIEELKAELSESDFKVMKCYEASILGTELPYDTEDIVSERQAKRDEINRLEKLLTEPETKKAK